MRYSATHKKEVREKIIVAARVAAKNDGFAQTGVDGLMASLGLTGGAFYNHFSGKEELFQALIAAELDYSAGVIASDAINSVESVAAMLRDYLSREQTDNVEERCVLAALGPEIARASPEIRLQTEHGLRGIAEHWSKITAPGEGWAMLSLCIGATVVARAVAHASTHDEVLEAGKRYLAKGLGLDTLEQRKKNVA